MTCNNSIIYSIDFINSNAYIKFGEIISIGSQDIEWKWKYDGLTEWRTTKIQYSPLFQSRAILRCIFGVVFSFMLKEWWRDKI